MNSSSNNYVNIINFLRAIASVGVCLTHLTLFVPLSNLKIASKILGYGQQGVAVFFVISGFIIPYSLWKSDYQLNYFFKYLLKRIVRIDPPYFVAILISITILGFNLNFTQLILHIGYLIPFSNYVWYQSVFWTLGIEFQFYILIGILFPIIKKGNINLVSIAILLIALTGYLIPNGDWKFIYSYIHYFCIGLICCLYKNGKADIWLTHILLFVILSYLCYKISYTTGLIGYLSALIILHFNFKTILTDFLGKISYSLYLTHCLVATLLVVFLSQFITNVYLLFSLLLIACIAFASLFYYFIEKPSIIYSKKIIVK